MKRIILRTVVVTLVVILGFSCSTKDLVEEGNTNDKVEAIVKAGIKMTTRAEDDQWDINDHIGLAMLVRNGTEIIDNIYNYNYYTPNTRGDFMPFAPDQRVFFPLDGRNVSFRAYYPYYEDLAQNMIIPVTIADQMRLPDVDLMSADHLSGFSKNDPIVELHFHHRLSKLLFNFVIQDNDTFIDPSTIAVNIKGMFNEGSYDLLTERLTVDGSSRGNIELINTKADAHKYGIVLPRPAGTGVEFEFTTPDGITFTAPMRDDLELKSGFKYTFTVTVLKTEVQIDATIEDWIEGPESEYSVLEVAEDAGDSIGAIAGDEMNVYIDRSGYEFLQKFTYNVDGKWYSDPLLYWQDIEEDPAGLRASIVRGTAYPTQLPDIIISEEIQVQRNKAVHFNFHHAAAKVLIRLNSSTFTTGDLAGADIVLPDYQTGGVEQSGTFVPGTTTGNINLDRSDVNNSVALIQPQVINSGNTIANITINGRTYEVEAGSGGLTYEAGKVTILNVRIDKEAVSFSVTIEDWENLPELDLDILEIGTAVDGAEGVRNGEQLKVYRGDNTDRTYITTYTYAQSSNHWTPADLIYWEDLPNNFTIYGSILRSDKYDSSQLDDYLVSEPKNVQAADGVHLDLKHAAAMVVVQLTSDDASFSASELSAMNILLPGYMTGGNVVDGLFIPGTVSADVTVAKNVGDYNNSAIALIQPQNIGAGNTVVKLVSPGGLEYEAIYTSAISYVANTATVLTIDMSKTAMTISANVVDWEEGQTIPLTLKAITIGGTNLSTDIFFSNKSIDIYTLGSTTKSYSYEYIQQGSSWVWSGEPIYWDDQQTMPFNIGAAYFPFQGSRPTIGANDTSFPWLLPTNQKINGYANYDLMMSYVTLNQPEYVNFMFRHPLSKVRIELEGVDFTPAELVGSTVQLNNFILNGVAQLGTASVQATGTPTNLLPYTDTDGYKYSAIVMPQTITQGTTVVTITLPGYTSTPFAGKLEQTLVFEPGKEHIIRIRLLKTKIELSATLEDWTAGTEGSVTID